jgi:hypothetical protein
VIQKLGIADAIKGKAVIAQGRPVGAAIASGEAEIGMQQVAELRPVPGIDVIGELPAGLQKQIPYSAGIATKAKDAATARAPVSFLRSAATQDVLKQTGAIISASLRQSPGRAVVAEPSRWQTCLCSVSWFGSSEHGPRCNCSRMPIIRFTCRRDQGGMIAWSWTTCWMSSRPGFRVKCLGRSNDFTTGPTASVRPG